MAEVAVQAPFSRPTTDRSGPELSLVMPCYNEEEILGYTVPQLTAAFAEADVRLELIAVDNGSADRTGEILRSLAEEDPSVVPHRVEVNEGYGNGILQGLPLCTAPWIGIIPADGQVDAEDVVRLYHAVQASSNPVLGKVRRRFRMDGLWRKAVSTTYNLFVRLLWPQLQTLDVNGSPKLFPRSIAERMELRSKNWLLDPEIMIKAHYLGVPILELNVFARMRGGGVSHVRAETCGQFLYYLLRFRFSKEWTHDFRRVRAHHTETSLAAAD